MPHNELVFCNGLLKQYSAFSLFFSFFDYQLRPKYRALWVHSSAENYFDIHVNIVDMLVIIM